MPRKQMPRSADRATPFLGKMPDGDMAANVPNGIARDRSDVEPGFAQGRDSFSIDQAVDWPGGNRSGE